MSEAKRMLPPGVLLAIAIASVLMGSLVMVVAAAPAALQWIGRQGTALHHRSITRSLAEWEREVSQIHSAKDAESARGMLEYIAGYYVVGPGNRSDPETEAALEAQRAKTIETIRAALEEYDSRVSASAR